MIQKTVFLIIVSFGLLACDSTETKSTSSPLVGTWQTLGCLEKKATNGVPFYQQGIYVFTSQGTILSGKNTYKDSNCVTIRQIFTPVDATFANGTPIVTQYSDSGETTLSDGTTGYALNIAYTNDTDDRLLTSADGFYSNSTNLCFSGTFVFTIDEFNIRPTGSADIDYELCLTQSN